MADWLVVIAEWGRETVARAAIVALGFRTYQPVFRERRRVRGRRVWVPKFLLGRYVLVEMAADWISQYVRLVQARGVVGVLLSDERPLVAREREVVRLQQSEVRGYVPVPDRARFVRGQAVVIRRPPLEGRIAIYQKQDRRGRDVVWIDGLRLEMFDGGLEAA